MTTASTVQCLYSEDLPECADSIESHPTRPGLFALATYQVDQQEINREMRAGDGQAAADDNDNDDDDEDINTSSSPPYTRRGMVRLYQSHTTNDNDAITCELKWEHPMAAVLDTKWTGCGSTLGVADSTGCISLFDMQTSNTMQRVKTFTANADKHLCLSLDWSNRIQPTNQNPSLIVSQSDGSLAYLPSTDDEPETWHAHDYEAWIAAFDPHSQGRIVWSGGDDLALKGWDTRTDRTSPTFTNRRSFEGGVTTMECHYSRPELWAVGSYDGRLRLFDSRNPLRPVCEPLELPGGIWRLKWHPQDSNRLLAGCMHGGFAVVNIAAGEAVSSQMTTKFEGHDSLAYGCDWDRGGADKSPTNVYSCSFYDRRLCAWQA